MNGKVVAICAFVLAFCVFGAISESTRMFPRDAVTGNILNATVFMTNINTGDEYPFTVSLSTGRMATASLPTGWGNYTITVLPSDHLHYNLTVDLGALYFDQSDFGNRWLGNFYVSTFLPEGNYRIVIGWDDQSNSVADTDVDIQLLTPFNCTVSVGNPTCQGSELVSSSTDGSRGEVIDVLVNSSFAGEYQLNVNASNLEAASQRIAYYVLWGPAGAINAYALNTAALTVPLTAPNAYWNVENLLECSWVQTLTTINEVTDEATVYPWPYNICDKEPFNVIIDVRNTNDEPLVDANVTIIDLDNLFEPQIIFTGATGTVETIIRNGDYQFDIQQPGYVTLSTDRSVTESGTLTFQLTSEDSTSTGETGSSGETSAASTSGETSTADSGSTASTTVTGTTSSTTSGKASTTGAASIVAVSYTIMVSMLAFLLL